MMIYHLQVHFPDKLTACNLDFLDVSGTHDLSNLGCNHLVPSIREACRKRISVNFREGDREREGGDVPRVQICACISNISYRCITNLPGQQFFDATNHIVSHNIIHFFRV